LKKERERERERKPIDVKLKQQQKSTGWVRRLKNDVNVRFGGRKEELIVHIEGIMIEEGGER
jgi:hypothetical protein